MNAIEIKKLRTKLRLTQEQFAQVLDVSFVTVSRWERGKSGVSALAFLRIQEIVRKKAQMICANPHCRHEERHHYEGNDCMSCRCSRFRKPAACPTKDVAASGSKTAVKNGRSRSIAARRASPPEIFVKCHDKEHPWRDPYASAHLRNRSGYVYLSWRDGQKVRSFYLGKAPRKCPTAELELEHQVAGAGSSCRRSPRRTKQ